jgi:hypothetical protein
MNMIVGNKYRFKYREDTPDLMYLGKSDSGAWYKFAKYEKGIYGAIWEQMSYRDLNIMEEVKDTP